MSRHLLLPLCSGWLALALPASAQDLSTEELARIRLDEKAALKKVDDAHGGRKPSEMSNDERRQVIQERQNATQGVKDKYGVSEKAYARQTARMGPAQNAEVAAAEKALEAQQKAKASGESLPDGVVPVENHQEVGVEGPEAATEAPAAEGAGAGAGGTDVPVADEGVPVEQLAPADPGTTVPAGSP